LKKKMASNKRKDGPSLCPLALQASSKQRVSELETNAIVDASSAAPVSPSETTNLLVASYGIESSNPLGMTPSTIIHKVDTNFDAGYSTTSASSSSASSSAPKKPHRRTKINMNDMMEVLTPGKKVLSIEYKNVKHTADLTKEVGCGCCGGGVGGVYNRTDTFVVALSLHCCCIVVALLLHCCCLAVVLLLSCCGLAVAVDRA